MALKVTWIDYGYVARSPSNPAYPHGTTVDIMKGARVGCEIPLPYPAPRCGAHLVECSSCGFRVMVSAAGRHDDPKIVRVPCKTPPVIVNQTHANEETKGGK